MIVVRTSNDEVLIRDERYDEAIMDCQPHASS